MSIEKLWVISDLHLRQAEARDLLMPGTVPEADICVVAGDVCDHFGLAIQWLAKVIRPHMPVIYVLGNHEFYGSSYPAVRREARRMAEAAGIILLDDTTVTIGGVRFSGGTLWTDFQLFQTMRAAVQHAPALCMSFTRQALPDFVEIYANEVVDDIMARFLRPADTVGYHKVTADFIKSELTKPTDGPTVIVTHHAPHPRSVHPRYLNDPVTAGFVSDMTELLELQPALWIHGHVHHGFDYRIGATCVLCNPRGYRDERSVFEWSKVVEIGRVASTA